MKEAIGYTTDDGRFFESIDEAEEYEAWVSLTGALNEITNAQTVEILAIIAAIPNEIRRYINANEAASRYRTLQASLSKEDTAGREVINEAIFEQQVSLDESLPDMGSGKLKEEIRQQREVDGIGSGGTNASDVRSSESLATGTYTKSTKARLSSSTSHIR